jgi:hypothetical protein
MERGLKKAHKTYILARRQILYRRMYETSKKIFCSNFALRAPYDAIIDEYLFCKSQVVLHVYNVQSSYQSISIFYF